MSGKSQFIHVLSTRLGIGVYDQAWFDYRLTLFENITVPSIRAQTESGFRWLIVVDEQMPHAARKRLAAVVDTVQQVEVLEVEFKKDFRRAVVRRSREMAADAGVDRILSSRIDDDDAIHTGLFARIHQEARECIESDDPEYAVFAPTLGCMWLPSERRGYTRYHDSHSIALTVMEPAERSRSVYAWPHREIKPRLAPRGAYCKHIDGSTGWWLYTVCSISDSDKGDGARRKKIMEHKYGYYVDDELLASYGITSEQAKTAQEAEEPTPPPRRSSCPFAAWKSRTRSRPSVKASREPVSSDDGSSGSSWPNSRTNVSPAAPP
ncbi:hypothetical protein GCM10029992_03700 [Glycomyces albus]